MIVHMQYNKFPLLGYDSSRYNKFLLLEFLIHIYLLSDSFDEVLHILSGKFGDASGDTLEAVTYLIYKTIQSLHDCLRQNKGKDYSSLRVHDY